MPFILFFLVQSVNSPGMLRQGTAANRDTGHSVGNSHSLPIVHRTALVVYEISIFERFIGSSFVLLDLLCEFGGSVVQTLDVIRELCPGDVFAAHEVPLDAMMQPLVSKMVELFTQ